MKKINLLPLFIFLLSFGFCLDLFAQNNDKSYTEFKGKVLDSKTKNALQLADLVINGTNVSTVTNNEGEFSLKVKNDLLDKSVTISFLGYQKKEVPLSDFKKRNTKILLTEASTVLAQVEISAPKSAVTLVNKMMKLKGENYALNDAIMTAFYRETIKKRKKNASLSEAVLKVSKKAYNTEKRDVVSLIKARKNTNYSRLDTLTLKLQGGPFSALYTDMIKYPRFIFTEDNMQHYEFTFDRATQTDNRLVYVINFKQKPNINSPLYYGKLYVDANSYALTSAQYNLNVNNRDEASKLFIRKKPRKAKVYPTNASYRVNYRTQNGKWYFAYSNISLTFIVNWKNRLFNSKYILDSEMAITDWETQLKKTRNIDGKRLRLNTILQDEASGFSDPDFWGEYNIIEPEKSIESAIKKISKQLKKAS